MPGKCVTLGSELRRHRVAAGLSQRELAERAGLSRRGLSDLERGVRRSPYPATVRRLAAALGLDEDARAAVVAAAQRPLPATSAGHAATSAPPADPSLLLRYHLPDRKSTRLNSSHV